MSKQFRNATVNESIVNLNFVSLQMFFYRVCLKLLDLRYLKSFLEIIFVNFIERIE